MAVTKGKNRDSDQSNENGSGLPGAESLAQNKGAKQDVHDWGHEIAEAGFEDVTDVDRPNEEQPIQANHDTTAQTKSALRRLRRLPMTSRQRSCQLSRRPRNTMVQTKRCARISKAGTLESNFQ